MISDKITRRYIMQNDYAVLNKLIERGMKGDSLAKIEIVNRLDPLIKSCIKKYCPLYGYFDDLYQDGVLIVLECLEFYDCSKATYLAMTKSYLKYHYVETFKYLKQMDLEVSAYQDDVNLYDFVESEEDVELEFFATEESDFLNKAILLCTEKERQVISLYYYKGMQHSEIAEYLEVSIWTIINNKRRALEKLRKIYNATK